MMMIESKKEFTFRVDDGQGLWGEMRTCADSVEQAEESVRAALTREEVEPNGSLSADFTITAIGHHGNVGERHK